jgi:hypothetical protein
LYSKLDRRHLWAAAVFVRAYSLGGGTYTGIEAVSNGLPIRRERWYHRLLHNETALAIESRLRWLGKTMVTLPIRVPGAS